jgi:hypothetical protein
MALLGAAMAVGPLHACTAGPGREDVAVQRLETQLCEKALECECPVVGEPIECGGWPPPEHYDYEGLDRRTLAFDPACVERWTSWLDTLSCEAPMPPRYGDLCPLYHGTLRAGDPCEETVFSETECGRGLLCIAGLCRDPQRTALGGPSEPCDVGRCDDGLQCIDSVCARLPGPGEPCRGSQCDADSRCAGQLCVALPGPGQPCPNGDCRADAFCGFDPSTGIAECLHAGDVGEPCRGHRECVSKNCPAGVCDDPPEVGDPCSDRLPCGPNQACLEGVCQGVVDGVLPMGWACTLLEAL